MEGDAISLYICRLHISMRLARSGELDIYIADRVHHVGLSYLGCYNMWDGYTTKRYPFF